MTTPLSIDFGDYCMKTCSAKCCRKGKLPLQENEKALFSSERIDEHGHYTLDGGCEHLDKQTNKCRIYLVRPTRCREFPYYERGKRLFVMSFCPIAEEKISVLRNDYDVI